MGLSSIPFLTTAIAVIISWAMFAILCSLLYEVYAEIKAERGRFMKNYLFKQLQDLSNGVNWASLLYLHGPIDLLSRSSNRPTNTITPRLFAESIVEVVGSTHLVKTTLNAVQNSTAGENPDSIPATQPAKSNNDLDSLGNFKLATQVLKQSDVVSFFKQAITNAEIKALDSVKGVVDEAQAYKNLLENLENWYSEFNNRLTLWYKKKTRVGLFILGALLGCLINVDSVQLFSFYNKYPDAKDELITYYQNNATSLALLGNRLDSMNNNLIAAPQFDSLLTLTKAYLQKTDTLKKAIALPVGWQYNIFHKQENGGENFFLKLIGILLSGFAASFGAPFWFELLKKLYSK